MVSHPQAGVHFRDAVEHLHLTDTQFLLHLQLISHKHASLLARASKQLVYMYLLISQ